MMLLGDKSRQSNDIALCRKSVQERLSERLMKQPDQLLDEPTSQQTSKPNTWLTYLSGNLKNRRPKMKVASKGVSPDEFFDRMFESESDKKALQDYMRRRKLVSTLTALRVAKGLTQADIAALMGCQQSRVSKLESGVDADLKFTVDEMEDCRSDDDAAPEIVGREKA